jgi:putative ABC transport system permease protein
MTMRWTEPMYRTLRQLAAAPGFTLASLAMLALGIGLSVAMYSTVQGVLLRGLPFPDGERVVTISARQPAQHVEGAQLSLDEAERIAAGTPGFAALGYYWWSGVTLFDGERAREITTHVVGDGYFAALGVEALIGRRLDAADIREDRRVAVLSYEEWQHGFGGDPGVIGRRLELVDEEPLEVVGVMPPALALFAGETGLWRPLSPVHFPTEGPRRAQRMLLAIGRLAPGVSLAQADAALTARLADPQARTTDPAQAWQGVTRRLLDELIGDARGALWGAFALAVLVLLIAAVNVAILLDARQAARRRELAVRQALGASRGTLAAALLLELAVLAGTGVVLGLAIAAGTIGLLRSLAADSLPRVDGIVIDGGVAAFAVLLGVLVPLLAALAGALRIGAAPAEAIRGGARGVLGGGGGRRALPVLAMALSTASLIAALTLAAGLWRLQRVDPGFDASDVRVMQFFRVGAEAFVPFTERLLERLEALPGVEAAALTSAPPRSGIGSASVALDLAARPDAAAVQAALRRVSPGYRSLLDVPLIAGRDLDGGDRRGTEPVALLSRTAARRLFGDAEAVGQVVGVPIRGNRVEARVVGVVEDIRNDGLRSMPAPEILVPFAQQPTNAMAFLVRSRVAGTDAAMADALAALDPRQAITRRYALADPIEEELAPARFFARTVGAFAGAALLLAVLGTYAVAALRQRRRVGEFGLRLAIGARPRDVAGDVLRDGLALSAVGVGAGLALALAGLRLLDLSAVGVAGTPPLLLAIGVATMALAALGALGLPAWRAARVPPMEALRSQ